MSELECLCPNNHPLPHTGPKGECTPVRCGGEGKPPKERSAEFRSRAIPQMGDTDFALMKERAGRFAKEMEVPDLEGPAAEEWAQKEVTKLLPHAVAQLKFNLLYSADKATREKAMDRVLDAGGITKKDAAQGGTQIIILNGVASPSDWLKPGKKPAHVVEGTTVGNALPETVKVKP